jgi:hypothetical protein
VAVRKDFVGLHRVALLDAHENEVVEDAYRLHENQSLTCALTSIGSTEMNQPQKPTDAPPGAMMNRFFTTTK